MAKHWAWVLSEDKRKDKRKWNWKRWPWNASWNWGGLLVIAEDAPRDLLERVDNLKSNVFEVDQQDDPEWREGDSSDDSAEFSEGNNEEEENVDSMDSNDDEDEGENNTSGTEGSGDEATSTADEAPIISTAFVNMIDCASPRTEAFAVCIQKTFRGRRGRMYGRFGLLPPMEVQNSRSAMLDESAAMINQNPSKISLTLNMSRNTSLQSFSNERALVLNHWSVNGPELRGIANAAASYQKRRTQRKAQSRRVYATSVAQHHVVDEDETPVTIIELRDNNIDDRFAHDLATLLEAHKDATSLDLAQNRIGVQGCKALGSWLRHPLCKLREINISANALGNRALGNLVHAFYRTQSVLHEVNLSNNAIGDHGAVLLSDYIGSPVCTVVDLLLPWNNVGSIGGAALSNALAINHTIQVFSLQFNNVGKAYKTFFTALSQNTCLKFIDLSFNGRCTDEDCEMLGNALCFNSTLEAFEFNGNEVTQEGAKLLIVSVIGTCPTFSIQKDGEEKKVVTHFVDSIVRKGRRIPNWAAPLSKLQADAQRSRMQLLHGIFTELDVDGDGLVTMDDLRRTKGTEGNEVAMSTDEIIRWLGHRIGKSKLSLPKKESKYGVSNGVSFYDFVSVAWEEAVTYQLARTLTAQQYFEETNRILQSRREAKKRQIVAAFQNTNRANAFREEIVDEKDVDEHTEQTDEKFEDRKEPERPEGLSRTAELLLRSPGDHFIKIAARSCHVTSTPRDFTVVAEAQKPLSR